MIQITLTFPSIDAARKAMLELPESLLTSVAPSESKPAAEPKKETAPAKKEAAETTAPTQTTEETSDAPEQKVESSAPAPASVEYSVLQKAVFALAAESREAAAAVAASFGVKTFKELPQGKWPEALAAVTAKRAELAEAA